MQYFIGFLVVIGLVVGGVYLARSELVDSESYVAPAESQLAETSAKDAEKLWGVLIRPYALDQGNAPKPEVWQKGLNDQFNLIEKLGANAIRFNSDNPEVVDQILADAKERSISTTLILDKGQIDYSGDEDFYQLGYDFSSKIGTRYHDQIDIYQMANEVTGSSIKKPEDQGPTLDAGYGLEFDLHRYENVRDYIKGIGDGLSKTDPTAKKMITGHWVLVKVLDYLIKDGVDFDLVGWNWYSDSGVDPAKREITDYPDLDLPQYVASIGKEFVLAEVNYDGGSTHGEALQAEYLEKVAQVVKKSPKIKGMFVHGLTDLAGELDDPVGHLGLVKTVPGKSMAAFGEEKMAFKSYQGVIEGN